MALLRMTTELIIEKIWKAGKKPVNRRMIHTAYAAILVLLLVPLELFGQESSVKPHLRAAASSPAAALELSAPAAGERTVRVLAIRADFVQDDDPLTSGDGKFDYTVLTPSQKDSTIDPTPHDRAYFLDVMEAVSRYYKRVSNGMLTVSYELFPEGDQAAYTLPHEIRYYNPNTTEEELDVRLSELLRDAVALADADPAVDFTQYDAVIVFHAGVGSDFMLEEAALDPTPYDIPSVYLGLEHLRETLGGNDPAYTGIPVEGGASFVNGGTILPETESKRGVEIGMLGISVHQFGHELGLPSLFNTKNGRPAIGKWGVMGVGFANFNSIIPAEPCAWSKVYMGWETPVVVQNGSNLAVAASRAPSGTKIYKVPVTPYEYFLIENRSTDYNEDGLNVVQGVSGVIIEVDDYDYDIPGPGMLIWHIDERIIAAGLAANAVNTDPARRGVDLEEADGAQDIGELFPGIIPGTLTPENGLPWDAFYAGNNSEFTPNTVPNSNSGNGGVSHIYFTDVGDTSRVMCFSVSRRFQAGSSPYYLGGDFTEFAPVWAEPDFPESAKIVAANRDGQIFALNGMNEFLVDNGDVGTLTDPFGISSEVPVPLFADAGEAISFTPALAPADFPDDQLRNKIFVTTDEPQLLIYSLTPGDGDDSGVLLHESLLDGTVSAPLTLRHHIYAGFEDGTVRLFSGSGAAASEQQVFSGAVRGFAGSPVSAGTSKIVATSADGTTAGSYGGAVFESMTNTLVQSPFAPVISDMDGTSGDEVVVLGADGGFLLLGNEEVSVMLPGYPAFAPAAGDIDGDGFRDVVSAAGSMVYAFERSGALITGFPVDLYKLGYSGAICTELILGDVDGDGMQEILFGTDTGNVFALNSEGGVITGFPLPMGSAAAGPPALLRSYEADRMELAAIDDGGFLYLWDLETSYDDKDIAWGAYGGNAVNLRSNTETVAAVQPPADEQLMPPDRVFNWPNPNRENWTNIRYYLNYSAEVRIKIYNQVGDLVATLDGPGYAQTDNEITWSLDSVESGVYFAQVKAYGNGRTEEKIIKIAVIK